MAIVAAAATRTEIIANAVDTATLAVTNEVDRGCKINTVYIECWLYGNAVEGVNSPIEWFIAKNPGNNLTLPNPATQGASDNKKFIFASGKGLVGSSLNGQPGYLIRGWFSIPKRYRRFGSSDRLVLHTRNSTANDLNYCFMAIYKWYK